MIDRMIEKLHTWDQNTLVLSELQSWCYGVTYSSFAALIAELEQREIISPVKKSGTNGCNPPLYIKYRILAVKEERPSFDSELDAMHYWIATEPLRKNTKKYQKHRMFLLCLSDYLKRHSDLALDFDDDPAAFDILHHEVSMSREEYKAIYGDDYLDEDDIPD